VDRYFHRMLGLGWGWGGGWRTGPGGAHTGGSGVGLNSLFAFPASTADNFQV
jgi:hypothetical protein